jgi:pimeloyl-ACP methyl ester carboxylesterase
MGIEIDESRHHFHYFDQFKGSFALISPSEKVSSAVIFVHGFGGDAYGTWNEFHLNIDEIDWSPSFSGTDFFFFQYSSVWERIHSSTDRLVKFLDKVIFQPDPLHFVTQLDPLLVDADIEISESGTTEISALPADRQYVDVVLVGHSEGGVVIRNAVDKKSTGNSPILRCQLSLFAPAIGGYAPAGLLGTLANSIFFGKLLDGVFRAAPAYQDLSGSDLLKKLRRKTEKNARREKSKPAFRAHILWGRRDYVVKPDKYDDDEEEFEDRNHTGVCKPNSGYLVPLQRVSQRMGGK